MCISGLSRQDCASQDCAFAASRQLAGGDEVVTKDRLIAGRAIVATPPYAAIGRAQRRATRSNRRDAMDSAQRGGLGGPDIFVNGEVRVGKTRRVLALYEFKDQDTVHLQVRAQRNF
jgi:hypothetical protein